MRKLYRAVSLIAAAAITFVFVGCQREVTSENLMENVTAGNVSQKACDEKFAKAYTELSLDLMKSMYSKDENMVISPLALLNSLMMSANGAKGQTLTEIENLLGNGLSIDEINLYLHTYRDRLKNTETAMLYLENGVWFNSDKNSTPSSEFLQKNADYYDAAVFRDSFSEEALQNINNWMSNQTNENLSFVMRDLPQDVPMYMVNAASLNAQWEKQYSYDNIKDGEFTNSSGEKQEAQMMTGFDYVYIRDNAIEGFMKYYSNENYAFVVLHPYFDEYNYDAFLESLTAVKLRELFDKKKKEVVQSTLPKFECEYSDGISDILKKLGVKMAFNSETADFSNMGESDENLYIDDIFTKAYISVTEKGTGKGTAASISNSNDTAAKVHVVDIDSPFVYMVVDCTNYLPLLIGTVNVMG